MTRLGESTWTTYIAYGALILLLVAMVVMVFRVLFWLSMLWIAPTAEMLRRIPVIRRLIPPEESPRSGPPPGE